MTAHKTKSNIFTGAKLTYDHVSFALLSSPQGDVWTVIREDSLTKYSTKELKYKLKSLLRKS